MSIQTNKGFSLIELVVTITIAGIITAVAWPSYQQYIQKSRNTEAMNALLNIAALQHQNYSDNREFENDVNNLGLTQYDGDTSHTRSTTGLHTIRLLTTGSGSDFYIGTSPIDGSSTGNIQYYIDNHGLKRQAVNKNIDIDTTSFHSNVNWVNGWD